MSAKVLLQATFTCADQQALARSLIREGLVSAQAPERATLHATKGKVPSDWYAVELTRDMLKVDWPDGSFYIAYNRELVRSSTRNYELDVEGLSARLASVEFDVASFRQVRYWDNPKGPGYKPPEGPDGGERLGWGMAFRGKGHDRAMSRRWLDRGPWRVLRSANDTSLLQFHDMAADVATSLEQARPCHALMAAPDQAPLPLRPGDKGAPELGGSYLLDERKLVVSVAGRALSRRELRQAVAARCFQLLGPDQPLDNVAYRFADAAELEAALPDLWLYGLEAWLRDGSGLHRKDDGYTPPPFEKPEWVRKLGRDDRVS